MKKLNLLLIVSVFFAGGVFAADIDDIYAPKSAEIYREAVEQGGGSSI